MITASTLTPNDFLEARRKSAKPMMWVGVVSIVMLFAGLTSAYIVRKGEGNWNYFELPFQFYVSTALIVLSSVFLFMAQFAIKKDEASKMKTYIFLTLLLGLGFVVSQYLAWGELVAQDVFLTGKTSNASGQYIYVISGTHLLHLIGGIVAAIFTTTKAYLGKYSASNYTGIEVFSIYWHFLGVLWVYLFLFFAFTR